MNSIKPIFSTEDADLSKMKWRLDKSGYARTNVRISTGKQVSVFAHHMVLERNHGRKPNWQIREVCDHINREKLDNRRHNLRIVGISENMINRPPKKGSKYATRLKNGKFQCQIRINKRDIYLGCFATELEATNKALELLKKERQ